MDLDMNIAALPSFSISISISIADGRHGQSCYWKLLDRRSTTAFTSTNGRQTIQENQRGVRQ
jgi:hypothetical protein